VFPGTVTGTGGYKLWEKKLKLPKKNGNTFGERQVSGNRKIALASKPMNSGGHQGNLKKGWATGPYCKEKRNVLSTGKGR